jgi:hypothetical protein
MPDFHQPDEQDRLRAEQEGAAEDTVGDWAERVPLDELRERATSMGIEGAEAMQQSELVEALRRQRPSAANDPNAPDRPAT